MASHQLAIAKASLAAGLLRADPAPVARDEIANFHSLLDKALTVCSPTNIQSCKRWVLKNMNSQARIASLGKYLAVLSPSLADSPGPRGKSVSARRKRLHVLYLMNDLLHHAKYIERDETFAGAIKDFLGAFVIATVYPKAVKQLAKVERLLEIWEDKDYYPRSFIEELKTTASDVSAGKEVSTAPSKVEPAKDNVPDRGQQKMLLLPPFHGDPAVPFYDLPAGNFLPHMTANKLTPINPRVVKPIQFPHITPDATLVQAVDNFLSSVDSMFSGKGFSGDADAVGGFSDARNGECYYGWSRSFCDRMKEKKREITRSRSETTERGRDRDRGRRGYSYSSYSSSSRSRSPSRDGRRRREASTSSYSRSRSRSRRNPMSGSRSRSPSRSKPSFQQGQPPQNTQPPAPEQLTAAGLSMSATPMQYGYPQQQQFQPQQQFPMGMPNWPGMPLPNGGFPLPPHPNQLLQLHQHFQQYGFPPPLPLPGGQWQSQPQQQQQLQQTPPQAGVGYAYGDQGGTGTGTENEGPGFDDYRSAKGREIGAKRGWKS